MSSQRFAAGFQQEAVRRVTERGYCAAEMAARVGGAAHSLYKWVKAGGNGKWIGSDPTARRKYSIEDDPHCVAGVDQNLDRSVGSNKQHFCGMFA